MEKKRKNLFITSDNKKFFLFSFFQDKKLNKINLSGSKNGTSFLEIPGRVKIVVQQKKSTEKKTSIKTGYFKKIFNTLFSRPAKKAKFSTEDDVRDLSDCHNFRIAQKKGGYFKLSLFKLFDYPCQTVFCQKNISV